MKFAAIGLDHRHIYEQVGRLLELGCECVGYWTDSEPHPLRGFIERYPQLPRVDDADALYEDAEIALIVTAAIPRDRAGIAIKAMRHGKDVMCDKPGCITLAQLDAIKATVARTDRIWSVNFSERFEVPAVYKAAELVASGRIGRVVQTLGMGPHRLNKATRPDWFFDPQAYGGVLTDIASHQIDQFLIFTGSDDAEIVSATVANHANPDTPGLEDFGEVVLRSDRGHGYIRVDWYTPDGLSTWGDGRLTILGTEGYIEVRKYVDLARKASGNNLYVVDGERMEYIDCSAQPLPYYQQLLADIRDRTAT
ncbi:MAG: Gfo/Idh/MocA family oxidoreductase, partial [bacterium]|nr:Gfo/Idh/MocA family oxidoreductase [bacterium]